jgi:flagellar basal-body rod protein FlgB
VSFEGVDTTRLLVEAMKVSRDNHRIIANNVANVDTPNFNPSELDFQTTLKNALDGKGSISLRRTLPQHFERVSGGPEFERLAFLSKNDYNKVDLDDQMAKLSENTGRYNVYGSLLVKRFGAVKDMLTALR